jgi:hypothetical protein
MLQEVFNLDEGPVTLIFTWMILAEKRGLLARAKGTGLEKARRAAVCAGEGRGSSSIISCSNKFYITPPRSPKLNAVPREYLRQFAKPTKYLKSLVGAPGLEPGTR